MLLSVDEGEDVVFVDVGSIDDDFKMLLLERATVELLVRRDGKDELKMDEDVRGLLLVSRDDEDEVMTDDDAERLLPDDRTLVELLVSKDEDDELKKDDETVILLLVVMYKVDEEELEIVDET